MNKARIRELMGKTKSTLKNEGVVSLTKKTLKFTGYKVASMNSKYDRGFKDILFINGCSLPHPQRYRVTHQMEQLEAYGVSCDKVDYDKLTLDYLKRYRGFVFYRCPVLPIIEEFIKLAKENNKTCFYDIDDLVYDTKYTDTIKYLDEMSKEERELYDDGVRRMGRTLDLCEYGITTTKRLQNEMSKRLKEVYINRNVMSDEMLKYSMMALKNVQKDENKIVMGYLSGSITHNDDFKLIMPDIVKILKEYNNVYLQIVGLLDLPKEMEEVKDKVLTSPFIDYRELPRLIRSIDINLAPLETSVFNEAKSENKWTEAALVKIPTIASNTGAFKEIIKNGETGILCNDNEWYKNLKKLIDNKKLREEIANNAYEDVINSKLTINSGKGIADFIKSKLRKNVVFVLPSTNISGGVTVAIKHGMILKKYGYDVTAININKETRKVDTIKEGNDYLYVVPKKKTEFLQEVDTIVATMWLTLKFARKYYNAKKIKYLVQNMETQFYKPSVYERKSANATYNNVLGIEYITISKWCQEWLKTNFKTESKYAPNGIDLSLFPYKKRNFKGKIKILIEGNSKDYYKNVDESFKIVEKLDKSKYEISYLSYEKEPKKWYYVDKFYHKLPHDEVGKLYQECDILIKTSILESFSYPPLEMMATGGISLVVPNGGNIEYLKDNYNCVFYEQGNIEEAVEKINEIVKNKELRETLIKNGLETAKSRDWSNIEKDILNLYIDD
ncbi:MAG: glycosyltransferase [Bacilli bacterium]|nr:glycosyltransferase [Bacilli bacterium]